MDYLSRLVGSASPSPTRQSSQNVAQQRLIRFKKIHDQLQQIWRRNSSPKQLVPVEPVQACLNHVKRILQDELQTPVPHLCARHVSTFQVYTVLIQVASTYYDEFIILETFDIFKILTDSEEVEFLQDKDFADTLIDFTSKVSTTGPLMMSVDTETKIVEVLFAIASKIRLQPHLLLTWFRPLKSDEQVAANTFEQAGSEFNNRTEKDVFPLFYLTLDYVHHEGRVGDFARTGLLYLIETAAHSEALEKWIVEGDLATLMASGLGALYSQLSRKLVLSFAKDSIPPITSFSGTAPPQIPRDAEQTDSPDFQAHLATFLLYLVFWQDILDHCSSTDVKQSLLDHYKLLFLQQLLYPSLIESSDIDGGSSVAVLTYLRCIIESIDHVDLLHITLQYLLALPERVEEDEAPVRPTTLARRRKSSILTTTLSQGQGKPTPDLFTLVDLVTTSLRSRNQQTVTATLQLVSAILRSQHQYAISSFVRKKVPNVHLPIRSVDAYSRDTFTLFSMAEGLIEHNDLREAYDAHLHDARTLLESHYCSLRLLALPGTAATRSFSIQKGRSGIIDTVRPHLLDANDHLLGSLVSLLGNFMANDIGTNLSLTQIFSTLASCGNTRLEGWLLEDAVHHKAPSNLSLASDDGSEEDETITLDTINHNRSQAAPIAALEDPQSIYLAPSALDHATSPIFATLDNLVHQVERFRHDIEEFDRHLAERHHVFKVGEDIEAAVANDVTTVPKSNQRHSGESARISKSRHRTVAQIGSISQRLMWETSSSDASRSSSPRGRQPSDSSYTTLVGRLNHLRISPSPSPSNSAPRILSPSRLRNSSQTSTPPKQVVTPIGPAGALRQNVRVGVRPNHDSLSGKDIGSETSSIRSESTTAEVKNAEAEFKEITLSHLLTNVIVLQEFILELAAIIEVRASLFGEVKFV